MARRRNQQLEKAVWRWFLVERLDVVTTGRWSSQRPSVTNVSRERPHTPSELPWELLPHQEAILTAMGHTELKDRPSGAWQNLLRRLTGG